MSQERGRSATPPRGGRGNSRSPSPLARQLFGDDMTEEEMEQYNELLEQFGGDEEALADAIEQFMSMFPSSTQANQASLKVRSVETRSLMGQPILNTPHHCPHKPVAPLLPVADCVLPACS